MTGHRPLFRQQRGQVDERTGHPYSEWRNRCECGADSGWVARVRLADEWLVNHVLNQRRPL